MKHGISDEEWEDYLASKTTPQARDRIEAHLIGCLSCWQRYQQESLVIGALEEASAEAREQLTISGRRLSSMFEPILANIRASEKDAAMPVNIRSSLESLKSVLDPVFGSRAAIRAMQLAANGSYTFSLDRITQEGWNAFLERLTVITSIICGDVFAGLIKEQGKLAPAEF